MANVRQYEITVPQVANNVTVNTDLNLQTGIRVASVWAIKTNANGTAACTVQLQDQAGNAISQQMSINVSDTTLVRTTTINDAAYDVSATDGLRVACVNTTSANTQCLVYCFGQPIA